MDVNPFQSPDLPGPPDRQQPGFDPRKVGYARQVPVVAVLMIVHGALLILIGIGWWVFTLFFAHTIIDQVNLQQRANPNAQQLNPQAMQWMIQGMYGALASVSLAAGILGVFAGIRNYRYRSRVLGIISLVCGMASILFCWCLPLSLGLLIYGLIIYLNRDAEAAFHWQASRTLGETS